MDPGFRRRNIRLPANQYVGPKRYFVTICCEGRRRVFSVEKAAQWMIRVLQGCADREGFAVHAYCVMPEHVHILAEGRETASDLLRFIGRLKHHTALVYERKTGSRLWQKKFYDHILRARESPEAVAWYIWMNPVRKGMCAVVQNYPFLGSFTVKVPEMQPLVEWTPPWKQRSESPPGN